MDNMQDILKNYYAHGGKTLFESAEHLTEAPYLDKNYIPVNIDDVITSIPLPPDVKNWNDKLNMKIWNDRPSFPKDSGTVRIDPYKIQKLTKGATPVVKLDMPTFGVGYYTFTSEDDKTVYVQLVSRNRIPGGHNEYVPQAFTKKKMSIEDFITKARESNDNISEAPTYPTDTYFVTKADLLKVIDSNYNIDHNKLMQLTGRQKPIVKVIKTIEQPVQMPDINKFKSALRKASAIFPGLMLPLPVKKVIEPGVYYLDQDGNGMIDFVGDMVKLLDKKGREISDGQVHPDVDFGSPIWSEFDRQILIHLKDFINYIQ